MESTTPTLTETSQTKSQAKDVEIEDIDGVLTTNQTSEDDISIDKPAKKSESAKPEMALPNGHGEVKEGDDI